MFLLPELIPEKERERDKRKKGKERESPSLRNWKRERVFSEKDGKVKREREE